MGLGEQQGRRGEERMEKGGGDQERELEGESEKKFGRLEEVRVDTRPSALPRVCIVGTGIFGRALACRLESRGIPHVIASRTPRQGQLSLEDGLREALLILAVPAHTVRTLPLESLPKESIVVDCSNRTRRCGEDELSQAEQLAAALPPGPVVVKALNTVSGYFLEQVTEQSVKPVPIASDSASAKVMVASLLTSLGLNHMDMGGLSAARRIENLPLDLFPSWPLPLGISALLWFFIYALTFSRYHFCNDDEFEWQKKGLEDMALKYINKTSDAHALALLAACYLPGVFAAYLQLARGTKYSSFPIWLDSWLRMRKQLGLLMLFSASIHACIYLLTTAPHSSTTKIPTPLKNGTWDFSEMIKVSLPPHEWDWRINSYLMAGVIGYAFAILLGLTSLPSISSVLSWREFRLFQSYIGWLCLILCTAHCTLNGWKKLIEWEDCIFPGSEQMALILPAITILLKIPLLLPCVDARLTAIRKGTNF